MLLPIKDSACNKRFPWATYALIVCNVIAFIIQAIAGDVEHVVATYGYMTSEPFWTYRQFTHMFMHGGSEHIIGNMLFLWFFGRNVERRLGGPLFLVLYFCSGLSATFGMLLFSPASDIPMVGASGAVMGIAGLYLILFYKRKVTLFYFAIISYGFVQISSLWLLLVYFTGDLLSATIAASSDGVAHWAHVGGFAFGAGSVFILFNVLRYPGYAKDEQLAEEDKKPTITPEKLAEHVKSPYKRNYPYSVITNHYIPFERIVKDQILQSFHVQHINRIMRLRGVILDQIPRKKATQCLNVLRTHQIAATMVRHVSTEDRPLFVYIHAWEVERGHLLLHDIANQTYRYPLHAPLSTYISFLGNTENARPILDLIFPGLMVSHRFMAPYYKSEQNETQFRQWYMLLTEIMQATEALSLSPSAQAFMKKKISQHALFGSLAASHLYAQWALLREVSTIHPQQ